MQNTNALFLADILVGIQIALVIFVVIFVLIVIKTSFAKRDRIDHAAQIPLDDDPPHQIADDSSDSKSIHRRSVQST